jgi:leucyl aminopeptidase (aminopeptidase T)/tetratricopeptide (TPR) repeat protein
MLVKFRGYPMKYSIALAAGLAAVGLASTSQAAPRAIGEKPDLDAMAQKLVTEAAQVKEGDLVLITGSARDLELLEDLAVHVGKVGAFAFVRLGDDRIARRFFKEVPEKYDSQAPKLDLKIAQTFDAIIGVDETDDPGVLKHVPAKRLAERGKAYAPVMEALNARGVRRVFVGNGLYPTAGNAKLLGISRESLAKLFWESLDVDLAQVTADGEALRTTLLAGKELHVTNPNGTDLRFRIEARPVLVSDGVVSEEKVRRGGAATVVYLPAGEVLLSAVRGSAEGTVVGDRVPYEDAWIEGLTMTFRAGKLTSMTAKKGLERAQAQYNAAGDRRDEFAGIDFGINRRARASTRKDLLSWIPAGMVSLGVGNDLWAGGDNAEPFGVTAFVPGSTVTVDGRVVVQGGELVVGSRNAAASREVSVTSKSAQAVKAFKLGRRHFYNIRTAEGEAQFRKALALDPDFALANAYLGITTPGAEGDRLLDRAASLSVGLPEPERLFVEAFVADRSGQEETARAALRRLGEIAPADWHAQYLSGAVLSGERRWADAAATLRKATALDPTAGPAYNLLGYAELAQDRSEEAIAAFKKYASVNPTEPNAPDSLGEALLRAGRFDESETAFKRALRVSPRFFGAWEGISKARFLHGDAAGAYDALGKAHQAASRPTDKIGMLFELALTRFAEGNERGALKTLEQAEQEAETGKVDEQHAYAAVVRSFILRGSGQNEEALKQLGVAMERAKEAGLPGGAMNGLRRAVLVNRIDAEAKLGKIDDAQKTAALLEEEARTAPGNAQLQSNAEFARGSAALARGDAKTAAAHFGRCIDDETYCRWRLAQAQQSAGDAAAADATRRKLLAANRRDSIYLFVWSQVTKTLALAEKN